MMARPDESSDAAAAPGLASLRAVAMLEAAKGVLALLLAGALRWLGPDAFRSALQSVTELLHLQPHHGSSAWLVKAIDAGTLNLVAALVVLYGLLRLIEAAGLWRARAWASWLGAVGAAVYVPFEVVALLRHPHWLTLAILLVNLLVVWVLARDLYRRR
ncbi:DUF2127 domain-containing protein [Luteimonas sp. e5]